jgi:hypothetical protein
MHILNSVIETINVTCDNLKKLNINYEDIVATGITNQRETTILWDAVTGKPLYNALGIIINIIYSVIYQPFCSVDGYENFKYCGCNIITWQEG